MFRKLHSNRDPTKTVFSELKNEFGVYFNRAEAGSKVWLERHSRLVFRLMVVCLVVSIVVAFTVFWKAGVAGNKRVVAPKTQPAVISDGFSRILQVGATLREMITLKKEVDSITAKKQLTNQDSLALEKDLDRLQQLNKLSKLKSNGH